jgi:hypothetical protein
VVRLAAVRRAVMRCATVGMRLRTYFLHNASLALGECNVSPRFVLDELDLNLSALATGLVIVVVVVVGSAGTWTLDAAVFAGLDAVAIADARVIVGGRGVLVVFGEFAGHGVVGRRLVASSQEL